MGNLVDDIRPRDIAEWESPFSPIDHSCAKGWAEFTHHPTDTGHYPNGMFVLQEEVGAPAEIPLLHTGAHCDEKKRDGTLRMWEVLIGDPRAEIPPELPNRLHGITGQLPLYHFE